MGQAAATALQQAVVLTSPSLPGQSWTYNPGPAPVGYWMATYNAVFAALGSSSTLDAQESAEGQTLAAALLAAGNTYDVVSTSGVKNATPYALQRAAWATVVAQPAWLELDRVCRFAYSTIATNLPVAQAAFAGTAPTWQPSTGYGLASFVGGVLIIAPSFVVPSPANGYCFSSSDYVANTFTSGTSGASMPAFPAGPVGAKVSDGSLVWTCLAQTVSPAGAVLPFDATLAAQETLLARYSAATQIASGSAALITMLSGPFAAWQAAVAAQPSANPAADAASATATQALVAALANAQTWISAATFQ